MTLAEKRAKDTEKVRNWREKNREYHREKARAYYTSVARRNHLKETGQSNRWAKENPQKVRAHWRVHYAIKTGKLIKQPCEICGTTSRINAHHDDYSRPLSVMWLCSEHHVARHFYLNENHNKRGAPSNSV